MRRRRTSPFARTVATPIYLIPIHGSISAPMASDSTSSIFCRLRGSSPLFKGLYASWLSIMHAGQKYFAADRCLWQCFLSAVALNVDLADLFLKVSCSFFRCSTHQHTSRKLWGYFFGNANLFIYFLYFLLIVVLHHKTNGIFRKTTERRKCAHVSKCKSACIIGAQQVGYSNLLHKLVIEKLCLFYRLGCTKESLAVVRSVVCSVNVI